MEIKNAEKGSFGVIVESENGVIKQIGLTEEQSQMLKFFLASISQDSPLVALPEKFDLTFLNK